jgi:hypothetical protein
MAKRGDVNPELAKAVKDLLSSATKGADFDQKRVAIELAMKFEALKLKAKGPEWGKGFDSEEGGNDDGDTF